MTTLKVGAVQAAPAFLDLEAGVERTVALIEQAGHENLDLLVFPEAWLPGYPFQIWLGSPAWSLQYFGRYVANSLEVGSKEMRRVAEAASRAGVNVSLGFSERAEGSLYLGQALIGRDATLRAVRRKLKPTHVERTVFGEGDGSDLAICEMEGVRIGQLCCWEHLQPLSKYALYSQAEQVHCAAWPSFGLYKGIANALGAEVNLAASRVYAVEGQCFVVAACAVTSPAILQEIAAEPERAALLAAGGGHAMIFAPDGRELAEALSPDAEGLVTATIELDEIVMAKAAADPAGHYARPDVTRLWFDRSRRRPVITTEELTTPVPADRNEEISSEREQS
jgi:aliphatic nitrilase